MPSPQLKFNATLEWEVRGGYIFHIFVYLRHYLCFKISLILNEATVAFLLLFTKT